MPGKAQGGRYWSWGQILVLGADIGLGGQILVLGGRYWSWGADIGLGGRYWSWGTDIGLGGQILVLGGKQAGLEEGDKYHYALNGH